MHEIERQWNATARGVQAGAAAGWRRQAAAGLARNGVVLPLLLVIVLAVTAVGFSPATAQLCAKLEGVPCGP